MYRRSLREQSFKLLFRYEFNPPEEMGTQEELFFASDDQTYTAEDEEFIRNRVNAVIERIPEIDSAISGVMEGWEISRIGRVELPILRLAVYEMKNDESVPEGVAVNEAVELARKFGQESAPAFVNAVLSKLTTDGAERAGQQIRISREAKALGSKKAKTAGDAKEAQATIVVAKRRKTTS